MTTFNPAAEHRCARCGQWWWKTHTCPDLGGRAIPPPSGPFEVTTTDKLTAERDALRAEVSALTDVLYRNGFRRCDVPACNCGSWHHRFGLPERMTEIKSALADAGHPLSNDNGNLPLNALSALVAERDALRAEVERLRADARRAPDAIERLANLVDALDGAFISSWQSTAAWQSQLDSAREFLAAIDAARAAQEGKT